jgi:hypothetical protein
MSIRIVTAVGTTRPMRATNCSSCSRWPIGRTTGTMLALRSGHGVEGSAEERPVYSILRKLGTHEIIQCEQGSGRGRRTVYFINTAIIAGSESQKISLHQRTQTLQWSANHPRPLIGRTVSEPSIKTNLSPTPFRERKGARAQDPAVVEIEEMVCERCKFTSKRTLRLIAEILAWSETAQVSPIPQNT